MDEQYFQDLYNWISSKDTSYPTKINYDQFKQKMQSPDYAQKMDSWIQGVDPTYFDEIKKKGQQKSALIPQVQPQTARPTQVPLQTPEQEESAAMASRLAATSSALPSQSKPQPPAQPSQPKTTASQFFDTGAMPGQQQMPVSESTAIPLTTPKAKTQMEKQNKVAISIKESEEKAKAEEEAKEKREETKDGQGYFMNIVSALDRGFLKNLIGNPIKGLGTLIEGGGDLVFGNGRGKGPISDALIQFGDYFNKTIDELAPQDEEFKNTLTDQFSQAFGQVASLVATMGTAGAVGKGASSLSAAESAIAAQSAPQAVTVGGTLKSFGSDLFSPTAVSAGLSMGQAEFDRAKEMGATDEEAFEAFYKNAAVGSVLEKIPVMQFMKRFNTSTAGGLANYLKTKGVAGLTGGVEEMTTEVLQQIYANKTAQDIYNTNQDLFEGVGESGGVGFGVGFLLNAMGANARLLRKEGKDAEANVIEAQIKQLEGRAEKGGPSSYSIGGIKIQPIKNANGEIEEPNVIVGNLIDKMSAGDLAKANIEIKNDPELKIKLRDKIVNSSIKEQVRESNPNLSEEQLDEITNLEKELRKFEGNATQSGKDKAASIRSQIKNIQENAVQKQPTEKGVLRTEQPEMGLPQVGQGSEIIADEEKEKLKAERNVELFPEQTEFANQIGGSGSTSNLSGYNETNGVGVATYTNPDTGDVDVIMSGTSDNDYVGFVRVYENGKPTNRFTSKMSNESGNKDNFKTMITQAQGLLPEGHEYAETTSVSLDGVRVFANQLNRGYEIATDANGNPITTNVTLNAANVEGLRQAEDQAQKEGLFDDLVVNTREEFNKIKDQVTSLLPNTKVFWNQANNTVDIQLPVLRSTKVAPAVTEQATQQQTATQETTQQPAAAEEKTPLQIATENRRKAKALLNSLRSGVALDPTAKTRALVAYHKALVKEAIAFIKQGGKTAKAFAKKIGTKYSIAIEKAWNEATGKITPIENVEDLEYTYEDIYEDDMSAVEGYEELMNEVEFLANESTKGKKYVQRDSKRAKKTGKNVEKAKAQAAEYKANFESNLAKAKQLVTDSAIYQEADDTQKDKLIRDVEKSFGISQKTGPSPTELFGNVTSINKVMEAINFLFDDANKSKDYLAEVYKKAKERYNKYKNSDEYVRNSDRDARLKNKVVKAKQEMDEYASKNTQEAIDALKESEVYSKSSPEEQKRMVEYLKDKFSKSQKSRILPTQLFKDIVDVKMITMSEKALLVKQIKDMAKGAKDAITAWKRTSKALAKQMEDLVKNNKITDKQMVSALKRFSAVDMFNEESIEKFVEYMTKVFNDAEYANKIEAVAAKRKVAKKNILTKLGVAPDLISSLGKMLAINPYLIPDSVLDDYIFLVNMLGDSSAVLNLSDKAFIQNKTNDVLNEVNNELALADTLKLVFDNYADKVIEDGKVSFSKTIAKMLKENKISEDAAELMKKYKSKIMPAEPRALSSRSAYAKVRRLMDTGLSLSQAIRKVATDEGITEQEVTDMLDELGREKTDLIRTLRSSPINSNGLAMEDERKLARKLQELIKSDGINGLDISQLETLAKIVGNINSGFISNAAQILSEKIESVNDGKKIADAVMTAKLPSISKLYAKFKKIFVGTTVSQIMIERNPLFYIDQVLGNNKSRSLFDALFKKIAQAESSYTADLHSVSDIINQIQAKVAASFKLDPAAVKLSSYKMMAYMIEREFRSNPDLKTVHSAVDFLRATIREIDTQKTRYNERDAEMLQSILNDFTTNDQMDIDKLFNSFNTQEEDAIRTLTNINNSLGDKALFTASVIRGSKINLIDNYVHRDVLYSALPAQNEMRPSTATATNNAMMPSTAAGTLEERTGAVSPLNFNVYNSVMKGARNTLLDYHMTAPVRTARMALRNAEQTMSDSGRIPKTNREIFNAIDNSFEKVLDSVLVKNFEESTLIDDIVQFISKNGYRAVLAGVSRTTGELASNIFFAMLVDPQAMITGAKYMSEMLSPDAMLILKNANSSVTQRVIPTQSISGKLIDTNIINNTVGIRDGKTRSAVVNKLQQIHNIVTKKYVNSVELVADTLISTPDKLIVRPIWFGSFANEFKSITGQEVDMKMIAANDEAYMNRYKSAIQRATDTADGAVVRAAASNNPFMGILKNIDTKSTGMKGAIKSAFNNFNSFMTTFLTYEYITARTGIYAAMGSGMVSRQKGVQMLAGVTTRMMVYQAITLSMGNAIASMLSGVDDDEEDQKDSLLQNLGQLFTSAATSMMFGRDFGNATKTLVNAGIEEFNKDYLDMLREGEYDPYKDAIAYSIISPGEDGGIKADAKTLSRAFGSFSPVIQTSALVAKNMFGKPKKEPGAIQRQEDEMKIRVPLEIAGEAGLVPFYKDIRKAVLKSIYASIKDEKKAEENKGKLLDKEWETKAKENVTALQKMLETESDPAKIKVIQDKIYEYRMNRKQHKEMLDKEEGRRKYKAQIKESLLGGYDDMQELKRYDPDLYEQNFGEGSKYYQDNKDEMEVESELNKEKKSIKDDKYDYTEPSKKGFGSRKFGTRDSEKSKFGSRKFGRD